jgi:hypothetical protein
MSNYAGRGGPTYAPNMWSSPRVGDLEAIGLLNQAGGSAAQRAPKPTTVTHDTHSLFLSGHTCVRLAGASSFSYEQAR